METLSQQQLNLQLQLLIQLEEFSLLLKYIQLGWEEINILGRDREMRLMKIHYKTETEKMSMLIFRTSEDRDDFLCPRRDQDKT